MANIVVVKGYFICERPGMPRLYNKSGALLVPKFHDWNHVFWGVPGKQFGRLPMALHVADRVNASRLIFTVGSAALETGQTEAQWIREYVLSCYHDLVTDFPSHFEDGHFASEMHFISWIERIAVFEDKGHNTRSDLQSVPELVPEADRDGGFIYVVTSANHSPRVDIDGQLAFRSEGLPGRFIATFTPAQTCYGGKELGDVVIDDLGDRNHIPWAKP